jgi:hypothetical protein
MPKLFTHSVELDDLHKLEATLAAALPGFPADKVKRMAETGSGHAVLSKLRKKAKRKTDARGNRPTFEVPELLLQLALVISEERGSTQEAVLRSISGFTEERGVSSELDRAAKAILAHHGLPSNVSLQHQVKQALTKI